MDPRQEISLERRMEENMGSRVERNSGSSVETNFQACMGESLGQGSSPRSRLGLICILVRSFFCK